MKTVAGAPFALRVARTMSRSRIRGAGVLTRMLGRLGMLDRLAQYDLGAVKFGVPLRRIAWDSVDVSNYESRLIREFVRAIAHLQNATLIDCGADIGTFAALVCSQTNNVSRILAFEPNPGTQPYLSHNLSNIPLPFTLIPKAVSNFDGNGVLASPTDNPTDHARYLVPGSGGIQVTTLDSFGFRGGDIAIKLDIEGGELEALKGAAQTIAEARECVIAMEASPAVATRTGRDPVECLRYLRTLRDFQFVVAETGEVPSTSQPLMRPGQIEIWNVVATTGVSPYLGAQSTL